MSVQTLQETFQVPLERREQVDPASSIAPLTEALHKFTLECSHSLARADGRTSFGKTGLTPFLEGSWLLRRKGGSKKVLRRRVSGMRAFRLKQSVDSKKGSEKAFLERFLEGSERGGGSQTAVRVLSRFLKGARGF